MAARLFIKLGIMIAVILVLLSVVFLITMHVTDGQLISAIGAVRHSRTSQSELLFDEARDIYQLITAEFVIKMVFPHDFIPGGYSIQRVLQRVRTTNAPLSDILTRRELSYLELYNIGLETGLAIDPDSTTFIVFTAVVSAGYDVTDTPFEQPANSESYESAIRVDEDSATVTILVPEPKILDITLEDPTRDTYRYPDIHVSPAQLRRITNYLREELVHHPHIAMLLAAADNNGRRFITQSLQSAGYTNVHLLSWHDFNGGIQ